MCLPRTTSTDWKKDWCAYRQTSQWIYEILPWFYQNPHAQGLDII